MFVYKIVILFILLQTGFKKEIIYAQQYEMQ